MVINSQVSISTDALAAFCQEHGSLTIQEFERLYPDVNRRTLQRDIRAMIEQGIVQEEATSPTDPGKRYVLKDNPDREL